MKTIVSDQNNLRSLSPRSVALDGSMLKPDVLCELLIAQLRAHPWKARLILLSLLSGQVRLTQRLAQDLALDLTDLGRANFPVWEAPAEEFATDKPAAKSLLPKRLMQMIHGPIYRTRIRELVRQIGPWLQRGDHVLDVGCGFGALGRAIMDHPNCPKGVTVRGLERAKRGGELIKVDAYDGRNLPYDDGSFDVVILADVLHHEAYPDRLMEECTRVARHLLIIKDHKIDGLFARQRISLLDWAANAPYGVPCLYRYNTPAQWAESHAHHGFRVQRELKSMRLYPPLFNFVFGRRLHYFAVLRVNRRGLRLKKEGPIVFAQQKDQYESEPDRVVPACRNRNDVRARP